MFAPMKPLRAFLVVLLALAPAGTAVAQQVPGTELTQLLVSRSSLESLLVRYDEAAQSGVYSSAVRADMRRRSDLVRARLIDGDFRVGDRVLMAVEGESLLNDTFVVHTGRELQLPQVGVIPLSGVLRFELTDHLRSQLQRFMRDPKVRARALIRVTMLGAVTTQGFYTVPVDITVDAALTQAGGPSAGGDLTKITIERGSEILYDGESMLALITQGATLDALGIQAGDIIRVKELPVRQTAGIGQRAQGWTYLLSLPVSLLALGRLFGF